MIPKPLLPRQGAPLNPGLCESWTVTPIERAAYETLFHETAKSVGTAGQPLLGGAEAREFFMQSGLPAEALAAIWTLSDMDKDNGLDRDEFVIAMHLCRRARKGVAVPAVLPRELVPPSKSLFYNVTASTPEEWTVLGAPTAATTTAAAASAQRPSGSSSSQSQMPHFALPGATFEQRIQLEDELASVIAARQSSATTH